MVVDDGEIQLGLGGAIIVRPFLEMIGELGVGHDVDAVNPADGREIIQDVLDHRLARDGQQRLGLREGERIQARGVTGGENDDFHSFYLANESEFKVIKSLRATQNSMG